MQGEVTVIEANIDDLSPQVFPYVMDRLLEMGALDVWLTPIIMKKNRSATMISILVTADLLEAAAKILFTETSTIGLRYYTAERKIAKREIVNVKVPWGQARVKISSYQGEICTITPEYEDCKALAIASKLPLKEVQQKVLEEARNYTKG